MRGLKAHRAAAKGDESDRGEGNRLMRQNAVRARAATDAQFGLRPERRRRQHGGELMWLWPPAATAPTNGAVFGSIIDLHERFASQNVDRSQFRTGGYRLV